MVSTVDCGIAEWNVDLTVRPEQCAVEWQNGM